MLRSLFALAAILALLGPVTAQEDLGRWFDDLSGWWRFENAPNGCSDEDNQYRVAVGRYQYANGVIEFGAGDRAIGLYEESCRVLDFSSREEGVLFFGDCSAEGDKIKGPGMISMPDKETLLLFLPTREDGLTLKLCPKVDKTASVVPANAPTTLLTVPMYDPFSYSFLATPLPQSSPDTVEFKVTVEGKEVGESFIRLNCKSGSYEDTQLGLWTGGAEAFLPAAMINAQRLLC